jgi:bifunctional DNA-binding transcriptional regulator/antitoxin component of YhaV-PrlF toxin-antitoxin module
MTVTADAKKRIVLPGAKPGDSFDLKVIGEEFLLTRLKTAERRDKVRLVRKHGYTLAAGTRPITQEQVRTALEDFP